MTVSCTPHIYLSLFISFFFLEKKFDHDYSMDVFCFLFVCVVAFCSRVCTSVSASLSLSLSHTHTHMHTTDGDVAEGGAAGDEARLDEELVDDDERLAWHLQRQMLEEEDQDED